MPSAAILSVSQSVAQLCATASAKEVAHQLPLLVNRVLDQVFQQASPGGLFAPDAYRVSRCGALHVQTGLQFLAAKGTDAVDDIKSDMSQPLPRRLLHRDLPIINLSRDGIRWRGLAAKLCCLAKRGSLADLPATRQECHSSDNWATEASVETLMLVARALYVARTAPPQTLLLDAHVFCCQSDRWQVRSVVSDTLNSLVLQCDYAANAASASADKRSVSAGALPNDVSHTPVVWKLPRKNGPLRWSAERANILNLSDVSGVVRLVKDLGSFGGLLEPVGTCTFEACIQGRGGADVCCCGDDDLKGLLRMVADDMQTLLTAVHAKNLALVDVHPGNVLLVKTDAANAWQKHSAVVCDLESATTLNTTNSAAYRRIGFSPPGAAPSPDQKFDKERVLAARLAVTLLR